MSDDFATQLARGRISEERFLRHLAAKGHHAIPVFDCAASKDGAPRVWAPGRRLVAADVLAVTPKGAAIWFEVKAKSAPGYRYSTRTWEHGVNLRLFQHDYAELAARAPLWLVVHETSAPPSDDYRPPPPGRLPDGRPDYGDYRRHLVACDSWRAISYNDAERLGSARERWSRGPGWLWPREAMQSVRGP